MSGLCRTRGLAPAILLILLFTFSCSRPNHDVASEEATQGSTTPFQTHGTNASSADTGPRGFSLDEPVGTNPPFRNELIIPAGTLFTVRLKAAVIAANGSNETFEAMLDEPVLVEGNVMVPRDAIVSGRIESAQISKVAPDRSYVRMTLNAVQVDGTALPIQTASLFARQPSSAAADSGTIRLEMGRRLTFRLNQQVFLHSNPPKTGQ